eukprot:644146-Amphidinium_carterae.1
MALSTEQRFQKLTILVRSCSKLPAKSGPQQIEPDSNMSQPLRLSFFGHKDTSKSTESHCPWHKPQVSECVCGS